MMNTIRKQLDRILHEARRLLEKLSAPQKVSLGVLAAAVFLGLFALVRIGGSAAYVDFVEPENVEELARLRSVLELEGIAYRVEGAGEGIKLQVAPGLLARARWLAISSAEYSGGDDNFDWIFEKGSLTDTNHKVERRVQESRRRTAEETIRASSKIRDATILIQRGPAPIFATDKGTDTASVALELSSEVQKLTTGEANAIRTFMVGSFSLPPQNVQITDNRWNNYPYSQTVDGVDLSEEQRRLKDEILLSIHGLYGRMFSPREFVVSVLVDVSKKRSSVHEEVYDEETSLSLTREIETVVESDDLARTGPEGALRPASFGARSGTGRVKKSTFDNFPSWKRTDVEIPAGELRGVSVNLVLDRRAVLRNMREENVLLPEEPASGADTIARKAWSDEFEEVLGAYLERHRNIVRDLLPRSMTNVTTQVSAVSFPRPPVREEEASLSDGVPGWFSRNWRSFGLAALGLVGLFLILGLLKRTAPPVQIPSLEERALFGGGLVVENATEGARIQFTPGVG